MSTQELIEQMLDEGVISQDEAEALVGYPAEAVECILGELG